MRQKRLLRPNNISTMKTMKVMKFFFHDLHGDKSVTLKINTGTPVVLLNSYS